MTDSFKNKPAPNYGPSLVKEIKNQCPNIFLVMLRDKNQNVVVYEANIKNGKFDKNNPVDAYWLVIDPGSKYRPQRRSQGVNHDREDFNFFDRNLVWGYDIERINDYEVILRMKVDKHPFRIKIGKNNTVNMFTVYKNTPYLIRSGFISASENINLLNLRDNLKELTFNGINLKTKKSHSITIDR